MVCLHKVKVALSPTYRIFLKFSKTYVFLNGQKYIKNKNFYTVVFKL